MSDLYYPARGVDDRFEGLVWRFELPPVPDPAAPEVASLQLATQAAAAGPRGYDLLRHVAAARDRVRAHPADTDEARAFQTGQQLASRHLTGLVAFRAIGHVADMEHIDTPTLYAVADVGNGLPPDSLVPIGGDVKPLKASARKAMQSFIANTFPAEFPPNRSRGRRALDPTAPDGNHDARQALIVMTEALRYTDPNAPDAIRVGRAGYIAPLIKHLTPGLSRTLPEPTRDMTREQIDLLPISDARRRWLHAKLG